MLALFFIPAQVSRREVGSAFTRTRLKAHLFIVIDKLGCTTLSQAWFWNGAAGWFD